MKKVFIGMFAACVAAVVCAAEAERPTRPRRPSKPSGGIVEKAYVGNTLRVLNAQSDVPADKVAEIVRNIRWSAQLPVEAVSGDIASNACPFAAAAELRAEKGVGAAVVICEDAKLPIVTASPDARWAILNVAPLKADNPSAETLEARLNKTLWSAVARALGAGGTGSRGTVLAPYADLKGLDRISFLDVGPETHNAMIDLAAASGIRLIYFATYRTACQQGWAPAPDTDERKAIWESVKSEKEQGPSNALKIALPVKK